MKGHLRSMLLAIFTCCLMPVYANSNWDDLRIGRDRLSYRSKLGLLCCAEDTTREKANAADARISKFDKDLDSVTVTATKVKVVYRGDTIVYNADAFNVSSSSTLSDFLRQIDGVDISDNGEVKVNERKVDYIMLNGKHFMDGKNKVLLDNLPHFAVRNVSLYDKETDRNELLKNNAEATEFVMDVQLKKRYSAGAVGNAEAGGGPMDGTSEDAYMGKLFGMLTSGNMRSFVSASMNNTSQRYRVGNDGSWKHTDDEEGISTYRTINADVLFSGAANKWTDELAVTNEWKRQSINASVATHNFLPTGSNYGNQDSARDVKDMNFEVGNTFKGTIQWSKVPALLNSNVSFKQDDAKLKAISNSMLSDALGDTINSSAIHSMSTSKVQTLAAKNLATLKMPKGDAIDVAFDLEYSNVDKRQNGNEAYRYCKDMQSSTSMMRDSDLPSRSWKWDASMKYSLKSYKGFSASATAGYSYEYGSETRDYWFCEQAGLLDQSFMVTVPQGGYQHDIANSYHTNLHAGTLKLGLSPYYSKTENGRYLRVALDVPAMSTKRTMSFRQGTEDKLLSDHTYIQPSLRLTWWKNSQEHYADATIGKECMLPAMVKMASLHDASNPLVCYEGNPDLRMQQRYYFQGFYLHSQRQKGAQTLYQLVLRKYSDYIADSYTLNNVTGARTYRQRNVDGVWSGHTGLRYSSPIGKSRLFRIENNVTYTLNHLINNVTVEGVSSDDQNTINYHLIAETLQLRYQKGNVSLTAKCAFNWQGTYRESSTLDSDLVRNQSIYSILAGVYGTIKLPRKIQLDADVHDLSRYGYSNSSMNSEELICNVSISKSMLRDKLIFHIDGYDILGNRSRFSHAITAQGVEEKSMNVVGRYFMARAEWRV